MITGGSSYYQASLDLSAPDVNASITDSARAGLVVYSIYWNDLGRFGQRTDRGFSGQNLLDYVTEATGGKSFWLGTDNPVSLAPYFDEILRRFQNQYELGFAGSGDAKQDVETLKLNLSVPGAEVDAPKQVLVVPAPLVGL